MSILIMFGKEHIQRNFMYLTSFDHEHYSSWTFKLSNEIFQRLSSDNLKNISIIKWNFFKWFFFESNTLASYIKYYLLIIYNNNIAYHIPTEIQFCLSYCKITFARLNRDNECQVQWRKHSYEFKSFQIMHIKNDAFNSFLLCRLGVSLFVLCKT